MLHAACKLGGPGDEARSRLHLFQKMCHTLLQEDNICELEMRLTSKQAEQDSIQERLTNSDMMVSQRISLGKIKLITGAL